MITIASFQTNVDFAEPEKNLERLQRGVADVASKGVKLAIFPEAFLTGYCYRTKEEAMAVAESIPGPASKRVQDLSAKHDLHVVYGTLERDGDRLFNAAVLVGPEGVVGVYRKTHLPFLGVDKFATPGDQPYRVYDIGGFKVGILICYDGSFPEATRCLMLDGADLVCLPTNWPTGGIGAAEHLTAARAYENTIYFAAVNRVGDERGFHFIGRSRICAPDGRTVAEAWHEEAAVVIAEIDPAEARRKHLVRIPGEHEIHRVNDRRPDLYGRLGKAPS
jgi:predicted amidohydrolase